MVLSNSINLILSLAVSTVNVYLFTNDPIKLGNFKEFQKFPYDDSYFGRAKFLTCLNMVSNLKENLYEQNLFKYF